MEGRESEYKAARFLFCEYGIVSFPAPSRVYDLLTLGGIRIEVKQVTKEERTIYNKPCTSSPYWKPKKKTYYSNHAQLTKRQTLLGAFDLFMIMFGKTWVFARQDEVLSIMNLLPLNPTSKKCIPIKHIKTWAGRRLRTWEDIIGLLRPA